MLHYHFDKKGVYLRDDQHDYNLLLRREDIIEFFHIYYANNFICHTGPKMEYNGVLIHKHPSDMFNYQQIIFEQQPDRIIECGAFQGGATLYFANLLDLIGKGKVISVDICERDGVWHEKVRKHPRVVLVPGSSTDTSVVETVRKAVGDSVNNFVILDSLHTKDHVLNEMFAYSGFLSKGNYMIVEDSNLNGHPLPPGMHTETTGGGPFEAIMEFLRLRDDFRVDSDLEKRFFFSFAASGYLVKQ